jgi:hypothetical protein
MRPLVLALLALLLVPVAAGAKDPNAPVRVLWNSAPDGIRARGTWDARVSVLQGPGGFSGGKTRPVIVVTDLAGGAERRVPMIVDVPPNTFRTTVLFPRAGLYEVAVAGFDPRDPARFTDIGRAVRVAPAPTVAAANAGGGSWSRAILVATPIAALLAAAWSIRRARGRATARACRTELM